MIHIDRFIHTHKLLNKSRREALKIPQLPKGFYWVLREKRPGTSYQILVRRRVAFFGWENIAHSDVGYRPTVKAYQDEVDYVYRIAKSEFYKYEEWRAWNNQSAEDDLHNAFKPQR